MFASRKDDNMSIGKRYSVELLSVRERVRRHQAMHVELSRRQFLQTATGVTAFGTALGAGFLASPTAAAQGIGTVLPIPTTLNFFGVDVHIQAPPFTGVDTDPSTVWNFQGSSGIGFIDTTASQTDRRTGIVRTDLPSTLNHMTFMQGIYVGRDGHVRSGTFSLV
jgi:hypothetical protein